MKRVIISAIFTLLCSVVNSQERVVVAGTLSDKIAIIDRASEQIVWEYSDPDDRCKECNSLIYTKRKELLYTYKKGATMIDSKGDILWEYSVKSGEEMQSVSAIKGGYLMAISGSPMRIVEVDKKGKVTKEFTLDTKVENIHRQLRQMDKTKQGNYIVPIMDSKKIVELDSEGEVVKEIELEQTPIYVTVDSRGDWLATCGHSGVIYRIDGSTGGVDTVVSEKQLNDGSVIEFAAGISELKNGNYLLSNWVGHNGDQSQPIIIELDRDGKVVWSMNKIEGFTFVATAMPI